MRVNNVTDCNVSVRGNKKIAVFLHSTERPIKVQFFYFPSSTLDMIQNT